MFIFYFGQANIFSGLKYREREAGYKQILKSLKFGTQKMLLHCLNEIKSKKILILIIFTSLRKIQKQKVNRKNIYLHICEIYVNKQNGLDFFLNITHVKNQYNAELYECKTWNSESIHRHHRKTFSCSVVRHDRQIHLHHVHDLRLALFHHHDLHFP